MVGQRVAGDLRSVRTGRTVAKAFGARGEVALGMVEAGVDEVECVAYSEPSPVRAAL
jgi:hypothetical protein